MNWNRLFTGSLIAAAALTFFDWWASRSILVIPNELVTGFLLTWLYVLARPRIGPGPRTAILMATIAFFLSNRPLLHASEWKNDPLNEVEILGFAWFKFAIATYLAGWQYIEKAP